MDMHDAFLADIAANRDDDAPRLIYADWLQEHGDPDRAAFIRAQCRLARMGPCDPEREALEADEAELLEKHRKRWLKAVPKLRATIGFARGFPHGFVLALPKLLEHGEALFAAAPTLSSYQPVQHTEGWEDFVQSPFLGRLSGLVLGDFSITGGRAAALLTSPRCAGLRSLRIVGSKLGRAGGRALTTTPHLAGLRHLQYLGDPTSGPLLADFAASANYPGLVSLDLQRHCIDPVNLAALARSPMAGRLEAFALDWIGGGDDEAMAFAQGDWRSLRRLTLTLNKMTAAGVAGVAACPSLTGLRELSLTHQNGQSVAALFASPHLARLERLVLNSQPAAGSLAALATSPMLASLRGLVVEEGRDCAGEMAAILASPASAGLVELRLSDPWSHRGLADVAQAFAAATHLTNLRRLSLRGHFGSGDAWARGFFHAPHLAHVVGLDLSRTDIGKEAYPMLLDTPNLRSLRRLWLAGHSYCDDATLFKRLTQRFGRALQLTPW